MLIFLLGALVLYLIVRTATRHGVSDAEGIRVSRERFEVFERRIESGDLPDLTALEHPERP